MSLLQNRTTRRFAALCLVWGSAAFVASCDGSSTGRPGQGSPETDRLTRLQAEVAELSDSVAGVLEGSGAWKPIAQDTSDLVVAVRTDLVRDLVARTSASYLRDVQLHLSPDARVDVGDEVRVKLGIFNVYAGKWRLKANIRRIDTALRVGRITLAPADSNRFEMLVPVEVAQGKGTADVDFTWDSATMAAAICSDFEVHDTFDGVVQPRLHEILGSVRFVADERGVAAIPQFTEQIEVRPEPTEESWAKIREMLERQNSIFRCGLAIQPERMEELLQGLLRKGFSFRLPQSIMKPIPLPAAVRRDVRVGERTLSVSATPSLLHLSPAWLWYGSHLLIESRSSDADEATAAGPPART